MIAVPHGDASDGFAFLRVVGGADPYRVESGGRDC